MPFRSMEQGIAAIQSGNKVDGARLLKIALRNPQIQGTDRANAFLWLSETTDSREEKIQYHQEALAANPSNVDIQQRLAFLTSSPPPPPPITTPTQEFAPPPPPPGTMPEVTPQTAQATPAEFVTTQFYRTVGIYGGPNGQGTGFFVGKEGLVATTRFVVGGVEQVTVELDANHRIPGEIVRSYPELDLAFIQTGARVSQLLTVSTNPTLTGNTTLNAITHNGRVMSGQHRVTHSDVKHDWFTTTIANPTDAGGNPVFDERNHLVGMLTRNANRTSPYVFGLHVNAIYRCVEQFRQEKADGVERVYCPNCGYISRAGSIGGFYCELCGSVLPQQQNVRRFAVANPKLDVLYGENLSKPCWNCSSRVGYYNGACLRCGEEMRR